MSWSITIGFESVLVLEILAKIHGSHSMGCAFQSKLWIDADIILQCLLFADGFLRTMHYKMPIDE
jgi:hypothetical protein